MMSRSIHQAEVIEHIKGDLVLYGVTAACSTVFLKGHGQTLRDCGMQMAIVSSPGPELESFAHSQNVPMFTVPMQREISPVGDLISLVRMWRLMRRLHPQVTNFSTPKAGLLGSVAAMLARVPCRVYTLRGLRLETATGAERLLCWLAERMACASAHRVVPVSESLRRRIIDLKLASAEKVCWLGYDSCGLDIGRFTPKLRPTEEVAQLRQFLGLTGNETVIGFVGRFVKDKGIRELVEAFRALHESRPNLRLLLVGDFESGDPVDAEIRRYIESEPAVLRPGLVADTAPYYALMDVFVLPTYREGFPGVPLEAQASEVPVVTTGATGAVDSVQHGITGLIAPVKDAKALTLAIDVLLRNPAMRADMGHAGRKWMEQAFRPEAIWQAHAEMYREMLAAHGRRKQQRPFSGMAKRAFDVLVATLALVALSPILAVVALAVRIFLGTPVLFRQVRPGYKARPFTCLKFRTMTDQRGANGRLLSDAERLTRLGRWLRSSSLDELPELINVIRGEMSLVGPRPLLMQYLERYTTDQMRRHEVRPGITGWAQVNGRNTATWEQRFACDVWYVEHRGFWLDLKILALTFWKTLKREGTSNAGHATMPEFMGCRQRSSEPAN